MSRQDVSISPDGTRAIVEVVYGTYHYHIAPADKRHQAYCGASTMQRAARWDSWGSRGPSHMPTFRYCEKCEEHRSGEDET